MIAYSVRQWDGEYHTYNAGAAANTSFRSAIYVVSAAGDMPPRRVVDVEGRADFQQYSPDGQWLYFQAPLAGVGQIWRCREDGSQVQNLTAGQRPQGDRFGCRLSRDGTKLLYVYHDGKIGRVGLMGADGSAPHLIAPDIGYHYMADMSPDDRSVVFSHTARGYVLTLMNLATGKLLCLAPDLPESFCPQFTPDGRTIVFFRRDGDVYRINPDGTGLRRLTTGDDYTEFKLSAGDEHGSSDPPAISLDGSRLAYLAVRNGLPQVHVMNLDGSSPRQVTHLPGACGRVAWSPDGRRLAFVSRVGASWQLFVAPVAGGTPQQLTHVQGAVYSLGWKPIVR